MFLQSSMAMSRNKMITDMGVSSVFTLKAILALPGTELGAQIVVSHLNLHRDSGANDRAATLH